MVTFIVEAFLIRRFIVGTTKQKPLNVLIGVLRPFVESGATIVPCFQEFRDLVIWGPATIGINSTLIVLQV